MRAVLPSAGGFNDQYGHNMAVSGDTAIVGMSGDDDPLTDAGAAFVYQRDVGGPDNWGELTNG